MHVPRRLRFPLALVAASLLAAPAAAPAAPGWSAYDRPATNGETVTRDLPIVLRDGVVLRADLYAPDTPGPHPVLVELTPYSKSGPLAITYPYLVRRGYAQLIVDVRGTGASQGQWDSFGAEEQRDGPEVVEWAARQPWSTGRVGMIGPSYMALSQLLTAAQRPPHLKAIFPIVPLGDGYRDIAFSGGALNASFVPLWLGLVAGGQLVPPVGALSGRPEDLAGGVRALLDHAVGKARFELPTVTGAVGGGDVAYDGPFWAVRSPLEVVDRIRVPTFVVGGERDLFQRSAPLIYERLRRRTTARLLIGPWNHLQAGFGGSDVESVPGLGPGLPADGVPPLSQIALRWFDRYLMGRPTHVRRIPAVTQYALGGGHYETADDWPVRTLRPRRMYLRGGGRLAADAPAAAERGQGFVQQPVSGICTQSTSQWTMGVGGFVPCTADDGLDEALGAAVWTTPPLRDALRLNGPILADLWITTTARDAAVTVRLTDVSLSGRSTEISAGWLAASMRAVDEQRSRYLGGELLQPWHPFTARAQLPVTPGAPMRLRVEVFPTSAVVARGHRLRVAVTPADFPHQLPTAPQLADGLGGRVEVLTGAERPSHVTLPVVGGACAKRRCAALATPRLVRR